MSMTSNQFSVACVKAGITHERCGMAVRDLLLQLRAKPMQVLVSASGGAKMPACASMSVAIKQGLARFLPDQRCYTITPKGETWLTELEIHGLIAMGRAAV